MWKATKSFTQISQTEASGPKGLTSWLFAGLLAAAMIFFHACDKPPEDTGLSVLPPNEVLQIKYTDTAKVNLHSILVDRVRTANASVQLFGNYIDPEFGHIQAATYTEIIPTISNLDFGDSASLRFDSLVLFVDITSTYGRFDSPQRLRVHELQQSIPDSSVLLTSRRELAIDPLNLAGNHIIDFRGSDRFSDLQVRLDPSLGKRLLAAEPASLATGAAFVEFFKGLYISTEPVAFLSREPGAIFSISLASTATQLSLFFGQRDNTTGEFTNQRVNFRVSSFTNQKYSTIRRIGDYQNRLLGKVLQNQANGQYQVLQSGSVIKTFVRFPGLDAWPRVGINRADLIIKVDNQFSGSVSGIAQRYSPPQNLLLVIATQDSTELRTAAGLAINSGATYNPQIPGYQFPVTNYIQEIISKKRENYGLLILVQDSATTVNRAVLGDTAHPTLKPELRITYTDVK